MAENLWQTNTEESGSPKEKEETFSGAPPPPQEVKVRTMKSDLESMAKSGGSSLPVFRSVAMERTTPKKSWDFLWKIAVAVISAAALFAGSYLMYDLLSERDSGGAGTTFDNGQAASNTGLQTDPPAAGRVEAPREFTHSSLFKKPAADSVLSFVVRGPAESATELKTFSQSLTEFLAASAASAGFIEIRMQDINGRDLAASEVLAAQDALVLTEEFLVSKFNPDPTFFVYKEDKNFFTGYVLALKPSENWLFLRDEAAKLEWSNKIENFFLKTPGAKSQSGFEDAVINNQPARSLQFSSGESFVYGWFRGHLILSASEGGFKEAMGRL